MSIDLRPVIITAVNDDSVLKTNLLASPIIQDAGLQVIMQRGYSSASLAYNEAMTRAESDILMFIHQDVYLPAGWYERVLRALKKLENHPWAVLGIIGKTKDNLVKGRSWSTGIGKEVGCRLQVPEPVESIDELVIVINKKSGIRFDEQLPGYHLYGTDIVQIAKDQGWESYVIDAPVIHNSLPVKKLASDFSSIYPYMQRKWCRKLPIPTLTASITRYGWPLKKITLKQLFHNSNRSVYQRLESPHRKAQELGYEE